MRPYRSAPQHPKGWSPGCRLPRGMRWWWETESAQPEKGRARAEAKREIEAQKKEVEA